MSDLEGWIQKKNEEGKTIDDTCLWYKAAYNHRNEIHDEHKWYGCLVCEDNKNLEGKCDNYKSEATYAIKKWEKNCKTIDDYYNLIGEVWGGD